VRKRGPFERGRELRLTRSPHSCALAAHRRLPQSESEGRSGRARQAHAGQSSTRCCGSKRRGARGAALAPQPPRTLRLPAPPHPSHSPSPRPPLTLSFALTSTRGSARRAATTQGAPIGSRPCRGVQPSCRGGGGRGGGARRGRHRRQALAPPSTPPQSARTIRVRTEGCARCSFGSAAPLRTLHPPPAPRQLCLALTSTRGRSSSAGHYTHRSVHH